MITTPMTIKDNLESYNVKIEPCKPDWIQKFDMNNIEEYSLDVYNGIQHLLLEEQYYLEEKIITEFTRRIKKPTNMQGVEKCSNILLEFNPKFQNIFIHEINVRRGKDFIDKLETADLQILRRENKAEYKILSGDITLSIVLEDIKINDIIEFSYSIVDIELFHATFFNRVLSLEYSLPLHKLHLAITVNKIFELEYLFSDKNNLAETLEDSSKKILIFKKNNINGKKVEKIIPSWYLTFSFWQIGIKKSWNDIANHVADFYTDLPMDMDLTTFSEKFYNNTYSKEQIVLEALEFIWTNIRYLSNHKATHAVKPTDPNLTTKRLYGDCKDFVYLLKIILKKFNIISYPVLVHSIYGRSLKHFLPAVNIFDHVILLVNLDGEKYFIDPTLRQKAKSLKNLYLRNYGYGLICNSDSRELAEINESGNSYISIVDEYQMISWKDNKLVFKTKVILKGWPALQLLQFFENRPSSEFWEEMHKYYKRVMEIEKVSVNEIDNTQLSDNMFGYTLSYQINSKLLIKDKMQYLCQVIPMDLMDYFAYILPEKINSDFYFGSLISLEYEINFLDEKNKNFSSTEDVVSNDFFTLKKVAVGEKDKRTFRYQFKRSKEIVKLDDYSTFSIDYYKAKELLKTFITQKITTKWDKMIYRIIGLLLYFIFVYFALLYHQGIGVPQNDEKAANRYRKAAVQGDSDAKNALANLNHQTYPQINVDSLVNWKPQNEYSLESYINRQKKNN